MVSCPFNSRKGSKCSVTAQRRTRLTLLALGRRPSLGWQSWRCYSSLIMTLDNIGGLAGPISYPPILRVVHTSDGRRNMRRFVYFRTDAHTWLGVTRYFICIYMSFPLLPFFFFFFFFFFYAWDSVLHWWLTGDVAHVVATCLTSIGWEASFPVEIFSVSRTFQGKRPFDINLSFLLFLPLATFLLSFCVWCLQLPMLHISPFVFSVSP